MPAPAFHQIAKRAAGNVLREVPLPIWERLAPKDVIAFTYHLVSDEDLPHQRLYAYKNRQQFESDVIYARDRAVTYDQLSEHRRGGARLLPNRILFTFDDGLFECFQNVRPILLRHDIRAIFFVNTQFLDDRETFFETTLSLCLGAVEKLDQEAAQVLVDQLGVNRVSPVPPLSNVELARNRLRDARLRVPASRAHTRLMLWLLGFEEDGEAEINRAWRLLGGNAPPSRRTCMTTAEVKQLAVDGFAIGSHGPTHRPMQQLTARDMEDHIVSSCETVRGLTGQTRVPFAFPYTGRGIDRGILADILRRNPFIDLVFDTQDFSRDAEFVVQRICGDPPPPPHMNGGTNLPLLMRSAWAHRSAWYRARP